MSGLWLVFAYALGSFRTQLSHLYAANQARRVAFYTRYAACLKRTHVDVGRFAAGAFFARQKARWTYSKGNPAKYRNDVREKIQSEKQVYLLCARWRNRITTTMPNIPLQIRRWNSAEISLNMPLARTPAHASFTFLNHFYTPSLLKTVISLGKYQALGWYWIHSQAQILLSRISF